MCVETCGHQDHHYNHHARTFLNITVYPRHGVIEPMRIRIYLKKLKPNEKVELIPPIKFSGKLEKI